MTTTVRNIMMSFTLAGSLLLVASPAMAQGRRPVSTGSSTMATSRSSESRQSVDRSSSSATMQSRSSATRQSVDRSSSATRQSVERPTSTMSSRSNESRVERPTATMQSRSSNTSVSSSSTSSRVNESRPSSTMNNNRPRPNTGTGTSSNGNGSRDLGNVQSATSNYTVPGYSNPRPGTNGNNGNTGNSGNHGNGGNYGNGGNNGNHNGNGGNNGNHYGNGGNNGNHNGNGGNYGNHNGNGGNYGNHNGRRPGSNGHSDNYRPDPNRGHNAYRDHYSWNHAHNDWSRPLPPPARVHRPAPYYYHRPVIPAHWRPYHGAPVIDRILGITFGTTFNVSLSFLYTNGYNIDGYDNGVVYLRNVHMMSLTWPDVMLCYDDFGRLMNAQFIHSSYYHDRSRYNRLYHDLCAAYGTPIEIDGGGITWFGGNRVGYVTLSMTTVGSRYYTNLYVGN